MLKKLILFFLFYLGLSNGLWATTSCVDVVGSANVPEIIFRNNLDPYLQKRGFYPKAMRRYILNVINSQAVHVPRVINKKKDIYSLMFVIGDKLFNISYKKSSDRYTIHYFAVVGNNFKSLPRKYLKIFKTPTEIYHIDLTGISIKKGWLFSRVDLIKSLLDPQTHSFKEHSSGNIYRLFSKRGELYKITFEVMDEIKLQLSSVGNVPWSELTLLNLNSFSGTVIQKIGGVSELLHIFVSSAVLNKIFRLEMSVQDVFNRRTGKVVRTFIRGSWQGKFVAHSFSNVAILVTTQKIKGRGEEAPYTKIISIKRMASEK